MHVGFGTWVRAVVAIGKRVAVAGPGIDDKGNGLLKRNYNIRRVRKNIWIWIVNLL